MSSAQAHIPIDQRPPKRFASRLRGFAFSILFTLCCLSIHLSQWIFLPLKLVFPKWWDEAIRSTKGSFAVTLIWMTQCFAPTQFIITTEGGYFNQAGIIERDQIGHITKFNLPSKLVIISNHQVYLDWWYLWSFTYWIGGHRDVIIVLKKSLKWIPVVGWGMIWFRFIFLARSWAQDSKHYIKQLASLAQQVKRENTPFTFFLYPEGTLVSSETRPLSHKWASKCGISDMQHILLPRTTGLHYALRTLAPRVPDLHLLDVTVAYEGIPRGAYGQSYFTLRSVFLDGVPPPRIHLHLKMFHVTSQIPIGDVDVFSEKAPPQSRKEDEISVVESAAFEKWLLELWRKKDEMIETFLIQGKFAKNCEFLPLRLRTRWDALHSCNAAGVGWVMWLLKYGYNFGTERVF